MPGTVIKGIKVRAQLYSLCPELYMQATAVTSVNLGHFMSFCALVNVARTFCLQTCELQAAC